MYVCALYSVVQLGCVLCVVSLSALLVEFDLLTHLVVAFKLLTDTASLSR